MGELLELMHTAARCLQYSSNDFDRKVAEKLTEEALKFENEGYTLYQP